MTDNKVVGDVEDGVETRKKILSCSFLDVFVWWFSEDFVRQLRRTDSSFVN